MSSRLKSLLWTWLPVALWLSIIAFESTDLMSSAKTGSMLYLVLKGIFRHVDPHKFEVFHHILRKAGHFIGYAILGLLFFRALKRTFLERAHIADSSQNTAPPDPVAIRSLIQRAANIAVLNTAVVASLDELHQTYLPSRTGTLHDVVLDTMGAVLILIFVVAHYSRTLRTREAE